MVLYHVDTNSILARPLKSRSAGEITTTYNALYEYLAQRGFKTTMHKLDNECPTLLKDSMREKDVAFQLVPPHIH